MSMNQADAYFDVLHLSEHFDGLLFDCIVSNRVVPALKSPVRAFCEMHKVLTDGGVMAHIIPDLRFAPWRRDEGRNDYQPWGWRSPGDFEREVMAQVDDLFVVEELREFPQFSWSFYVVARKR